MAGAGLLAWIEGGGADARGPLPRADRVPASDAATAGASPGSDAYDVKMRLAEMLGDAVIEVPSLAASRPSFQSHWRKLRGPWLRPSGVGAELVTTIALQTNRQAEPSPAAPSATVGPAPVPPTPAEDADAGASDDSGAKKPWVPDVRVWNMNEGSFDQREAIYAPTPATLVFHLSIPPAARLRVSPGVAAPPVATTVFDATIVDATGREQVLAEAHIGPGDEWRWLDVDADLAPWAGQRVGLRLRTWTLPDRKAARAEATATGGEHGGIGTVAGSSATSPRVREPSPPGDGGPERPAPPPISLALWGDPVIVAKEPTRVPFNVVWIVVDAMRPDITASLHDPKEDAEKLAAEHPPLDALLPQVPGLMPSLDRLAARGVHFTHAWSAASWTRPGTLAMLTGERSSELGIDTSNWVQPADRIARYYASDPPLLPRLLQRSGLTTAAFVNNFFMTGYANVGLDMGFQRVTDHRYRTRDTALITYDALAWLDVHAADRFFLFLNFNSPHGPYDPTKEMLARIPPPPAGPRDGQVRAYMAEAAKDDTAIGVLLDKIDALGLRASTLVVVSADHGETLSAAHDASILMGADKVPMRFHHAVGNFEETTRIPILMALPGVVDGGRARPERARSIDIAPTILEIEGLEPDARMSGRSLLPLVRGKVEPEPRVVVSEGRYSRAILWGKWRLVAHDAPAHPARTQPDGGKPAPPPEDELYDLADDPGERRNVAHAQPDVVAEMRARLAAALANVPAADAQQSAPVVGVSPTVHLRFAGAGAVHRVTGVLTAGDDKHPATIAIEPSGTARDAFRVDGSKVDFAFGTAPDAVVGFDIRVDPPTAPIAWRLFLDDVPWPGDATFTGPFGLPANAARTGIATPEARAEVFAPAPAMVDPTHDLGMFRDPGRGREDRGAWQGGPGGRWRSRQRRCNACSRNGATRTAVAINGKTGAGVRLISAPRMRLASLLSPDIKQILKEDPDQIRELFDEIHPEDLADIVGELDPDEAAELLARLPAEEAAPIFERLDEHEQGELIEQMPAQSIAQIASEMAADDRADLFSALPPAVGEQLFEALEKVDPEAAQEVREIEKWPDTSAGHLMTSDYLAVSPRMTVGGALEIVRKRSREREDFVYVVYVLDQDTLAGVVSLRDLLAAEPEHGIAEIMRSNVISAPPTMDQEDVARRMAKYDLNVMPVVADDGKLLGIITIDDIIDVLVQEQTEDVQKIGAMEPLDVPYFQTSLVSFIRKRAGWLIILFIEEFFTQTALRFYDPVMEAVKGALLYVPLLISAGGNSGSQSSTLVIRGLAIGEIKLTDWWRILLRETVMGVVLGCLIAVIAMGRVMMYPDQTFYFALTVGITVLFIILSGCTVGSMLPVIMKRLGIDPATSSTPFIASLVDTLGVVIYAHVAMIVMHQTIDAHLAAAAAGVP